jgi:nucleoside-diphosphate-sugar epimerase
MGEMTAILVTGANGFLGRQIVAAARARGLPVRALVRRPAPEAPWAGDDGVEEIVRDLSAPGALPMEGVGAVIHAAALMSGDDAAHAIGTLAPMRAVLDAMIVAGTPRLVLVSSFSVYGYAALPTGCALDETVPVEPDPHLRDAYCRAKLAQEAMVAEAVQHHGLTARILRPGAIYGDGHLWTARLGLRKGPLAILLGGRAAVPAVHVDGCAEALVLAAIAPPPPRSDIPTPNGGALDVINIVDDGAPDQASWMAAIAPRLGIKRTIRIPAKPLFLIAKILGLAEIVFPALPRRLPALMREGALSARIKPLRYPNHRARERLGWIPGADFDANIKAAEPKA